MGIYASYIPSWKSGVVRRATLPAQFKRNVSDNPGNVSTLAIWLGALIGILTLWKVINMTKMFHHHDSTVTMYRDLELIARAIHQSWGIVENLNRGLECDI